VSTDVSEAVARYYSAKLAAHGPTPRGVDWNSAESQELRFTKLLTVCDRDRDASILDFGCGYGALAARLRRDGYSGEYVGYDLSHEMVQAATATHRLLPRCRFTSDAATLNPSAYTLASGIFNVRLDVGRDDWERHIRETLDAMAALTVHGFAFNMLTRYADADRMRPDLYYADPGLWLTHCLDRFSRHVALLHDYGLYEFTIVVRTSGDRRG
jgi:SAM-dependent methyltransferase